MADKALRVVLVGDASSLQRALQAAAQAADAAKKPVEDLGNTSQQAVAKVEGFGDAFASAGRKLGLQVAAIGAVVTVMHQASGAVGDYTASVDRAEKQILGFTKSQQYLAQAQALARREQEAGRATYQETIEALAAITPLANRYNLNLEDVLRTTQLLAALDPVQGVEGARIAMNEALSGDFTSLQRRFELPRAEIQKLKDEGVPNLQIVQRILKDLGVDEQYLNTVNANGARQWELLKGNLTEFAAVADKPIMDKLIAGVVKLNKETQGDGGMSFAKRLAQDLEEVFAGHGFERSAIIIQQTLAVIAASINDFFKLISGGRVNFDGPLRDYIKSIQADEDRLRQAMAQHVVKPVQEGFSEAGKSSASATGAFEGYGREMLRAVVRGLTAEQIDTAGKISGIFGDLFKGSDGKADADQAAAAQAVVAQALRELARDGQLSSDTMRDLSAVFKDQTPAVFQLITAQNNLTQAQQRAKLAADELATAQNNLTQVQNRAKGDLAGYEQAVSDAQATAARHAQEAADATEELNRQMAGVRDQAEASARASQAEIDRLNNELEGMQAGAAARQAESQRQIDAAQAAYAAAQTHRQQLQQAMNAALRGEVEEWLRINDITDESIRKIAQKWQEEIAGQRRAKEGADDRVKALSRQGNREELDYLNRIDAARKAGNEREARRLERERDARRKQRSSEEERARAEAAVANDNYEERKEQLEKQGKQADENASNEEKAALAELNRIKDAAAAQKAADDAAIQGKRDQIKAVQEAQKAEQARYADQQRGIQAEINKIQEAAREQAKKDKKAIDDAQALYLQRKAYWDVELAGAGTAVNLFGAIAGSNKTMADDSKTALDNLAAITKLDFSNVLAAAQAAKEMANKPPAPPPPPSTQSPTPLASGPQATPGQTEAGFGAPGAQGTGAGLLPYNGSAPPPGYHAERATDGIWFVPNGMTLADFGKTPAPARSSNGGDGDSTSMSAASVGGPQFARAGMGLQFQRADPAPDGGTLGDLHIHLPNVRDLGDKSQRDEIWQALRREFKDARRAGLDPGKVEA